MTHDPTLSNAAGAYALHALDPDEAAAFEERMREDDELRAEVTSLADTAVELGLAAPAEDPGAALRARILDAVAATPQLPAEPSGIDPAAGTEPVEAAPVPRAVVDLAAHRLRRTVLALSGAVAAAALVLGGVALSNTVTHQQQIAATASRIDAIRAAADAEHSTAPITGGGAATVVWSAALGRSAVVVRDLPQPAAGRTYELWYIGDDGATPAGTFAPDADGRRSIVLEGRLRDGDAIGMTIEPSGGSAAPTTDPVLTVATS